MKESGETSSISAGTSVEGTVREGSARFSSRGFAGNEC